MSDTMKLALQITAVDMLSGIVSRAKNSILGLGTAGKQVQKDFDIMEKSITRGLKAIAVGIYAINKIKPGISAAADLQEAMLNVKMNLAGSAKNAEDLTNQLKQVKSTAITVSADAPFSAEDVVKIQNSLLKAGLSLKDVTGKAGAAFAAVALASLSKETPEAIGDALAAIGTQFSIEGEGYTEFADWLVRVDDAGSAKVPLLIQGLRMSGSMANALGLSAKDSVTALGALATLGERAGSSYSNFLAAIINKGAKLEKLDIKLFEGGDFVGMARTIDILKDKFGDIEDTQKRLNALNKIFGEEGGRAANEFLNSAKGFKEIETAAKASLSMAEKMTIWGEGMKAAMAKLGGTARSTLANLFDPLLKPLKELIDLLNQIVGKIGEIVDKSPALAKSISYGAVGIMGGTLGYGAYQLAKGGLAGGRVLKGVGGIKGLLGGTTAGIAKGKAVEAATGVAPVFVTNWPVGGGIIGASAGGDATKKIATAAAAGGILSKLGSVGLAAGVAFGGAKLITGKYDAAISNWLNSIADKLGIVGAGITSSPLPDKKDKIVINLNQRIDENGRVFTESDSMNTELNTNLKRGKF